MNSKYKHIDRDLRNLPHEEVMKVLLVKILEELEELNETVEMART